MLETKFRHSQLIELKNQKPKQQFKSVSIIAKKKEKNKNQIKEKIKNMFEEHKILLDLFDF